MLEGTKGTSEACSRVAATAGVTAAIRVALVPAGAAFDVPTGDDGVDRVGKPELGGTAVTALRSVVVVLRSRSSI